MPNSDLQTRQLKGGLIVLGLFLLFFKVIPWISEKREEAKRTAERRALKQEQQFWEQVEGVCSGSPLLGAPKYIRTPGQHLLRQGTFLRETWRYDVRYPRVDREKLRAPELVLCGTQISLRTLDSCTYQVHVVGTAQYVGKSFVAERRVTKTVFEIREALTANVLDTFDQDDPLPPPCPDVFPHSRYLVYERLFGVTAIVADPVNVDSKEVLAWIDSFVVIR
jgi:hypothetical protein